MNAQKYEYKISARVAARIAEFAERFYNHIPPVCWKTEETLAKELGVDRRQIRNAKKYLIEAGRLILDIRKNGKRSNPVHTLVKLTPINQNTLDELSDEGINRIDWSLFNDVSARDLNEMSVKEHLDFYEQMRLPFIPLHFPKWDKNDNPYCSCQLGRNCPSIGKHPVISYKDWNFSDERTFREMKSFWLEDTSIDNVDCNNGYNIGFITDGVTVIDIDFRNGGQHSLEHLEEIYGELPRNLMVKTGNGWHIYVRGNNKIKNNTNILDFKGVDIRSNGSFIVAPFSDHKSGKKYEWLSVSPPERLPQDLIDALQSEGKQLHNSKPNGKRIDTNSVLPSRSDKDFFIPEGSRNNMLFRLASRERGDGAELPEIFNYLRLTNANHCQPPLNERLLTHIAKSVMKYKTNREKAKA